MTSIRWHQLKELFHAALEKDPPARAEFLAHACGGDVELRAEIESLIAAHERPGSFLNIAEIKPNSAAGVESDSATKQPKDLEPGSVLGHYKITRTLGEGGMGKVYLAQDTRLGRKVALKLLPQSFTTDHDRVRRFEQEARAASALNHPNILTIHEIGAEGNTRYIATEFVEGITLREHLKQFRLKLTESLDLAIQIAAALSAAHAAGIVHRDIKPENLIVRPDGYVKVLDFGLAKLAPSTQAAAKDSDSLAFVPVSTTPGMLMGTIVYMSPEQARGFEVDARTDIWSLGVVLYEMIAGRPPFEGHTNSDVLASVLNREPLPLTHHSPAVSAELERIVLKTLAKDPEERYQAIKDLLVDLRRHKQRLEFEAEMRRSSESRQSAVETPPPDVLVPSQPPSVSIQYSSEQRKQITILCADISGLTAISESLDAEEMNDIMSALWQRLDTTVMDHGGMIDKHMGDLVMALWGAQSAHEDDPERAIRAALLMQTEAAEVLADCLGDRVPNEVLSSLVRVGINTGPVLLTAVGTRGEFTAAGASVNVASRLEQAAPAGSILISHDTYRHVRGVFDVHELELSNVKGEAEPVHTYVVERVKPRAFRLRTRGVEGIETRMIGRRGELDRLTDALSTVMEDRELRAVTVIGEAGIGKSRLLYEFSNEVELLPQRFCIFNGRANQAVRGQPFSLVRDVFAFRFEIQDSDSPMVAREKLERGMLALDANDDGALMRAHFIGQMIGLDFSASPFLAGIIDDARQIRDRAFHYATQFFTTVAAKMPVILYLDDIHWADDGSLDFVNHLMRSCRAVPLMIFSLARPALLERRPSWGEGETAHDRLTLELLTKRESRQLVEEILRHAQSIPQALRELVVGGAEGNPFYVEELIKMLIDQRVILPGGSQWRVDASRLVEVRVPSTLTGVLQARLDGLSAWEKIVIQRASIIGREFWDHAVEFLGAQLGESSHDPPSADTRAALEKLRRRELIYRREASTFLGAMEYLFKHAILRDVTYESVLRRERRKLHKLAADWLIERSGERADQFAATIAEHYERARVAANAAEWYGRAGEQARDAYAPEAAIGFYRKALELGPTDTAASTENRAREILWHEGLGEALWMQARFPDAVAAYKTMLELAEGEGDHLAQARACNGLASVQDRVGDYRAMLESAKSAGRLARAAGTSARAVKELARALDRQGWAAYRLGDAADAIGLCEQALNLAVELGASASRERGHSLKSLGVVYLMLGQFVQAESCFEQAMELHRELGNRRGVGNLLNSLGEAARLRGDSAAAVRWYEEALIITREIGDRGNEMTYLSNLGGARVGLKDWRAAETDLHEVTARVGSDRFYALSETYSFLAEACLGQDKLDEARTAVAVALELALETENPEYIGGMWRTLGLVAARTPEGLVINDETHDPRSCFAESLRIWTQVDAQAERARTLQAWANYERECGDETRYRELSSEAQEIFSRLKMEIEIV
jgi:serine/threonine protein kinase/tetratricopeptide (TPR) repeat protein